MRVDSDQVSFGTQERFGMFNGKGGSRVLLREPERCLECGKVFISLYALKSCSDHEGLDRI
ncbi:MAG: hypothetical protein HY891_02055 [Deltaproteobacteria bacterium]|nr:hypothetical protein [Deltaproteobacteria bacterium]